MQKIMRKTMPESATDYLPKKFSIKPGMMIYYRVKDVKGRVTAHLGIGEKSSNIPLIDERVMIIAFGLVEMDGVLLVPATLALKNRRNQTKIFETGINLHTDDDGFPCVEAFSRQQRICLDLWGDSGDIERQISMSNSRRKTWSEILRAAKKEINNYPSVTADGYDRAREKLWLQHPSIEELHKWLITNGRS